MIISGSSLSITDGKRQFFTDKNNSEIWVVVGEGGSAIPFPQGTYFKIYQRNTNNDWTELARFDDTLNGFTVFPLYVLDGYRCALMIQSGTELLLPPFSQSYSKDYIYLQADGSRTDQTSPSFIPSFEPLFIYISFPSE